MFSQEKKKINTTLCFVIPTNMCFTPKKKSPEQPNAKKAVHLETPIRHLGGVAENQLACLL